MPRLPLVLVPGFVPSRNSRLTPIPGKTDTTGKERKSGVQGMSHRLDDGWPADRLSAGGYNPCCHLACASGLCRGLPSSGPYRTFATRSTQPAAEVLPQPPEQGGKEKKGYRYRVAIPSEIPGAGVPPIQMPRYNPQDPNALRAALERLYHGLPPLPPRVESQPGPCGRPMSLVNLQTMAIQRSPLVRQAQADVTTARGNMIQAGTPQNPNVGFEGDTIGTGHTGGYQGVAIEQMIPTGGKLRLARSAREMDFNNAQLALRRTYFDV